MNKLIKNEWSKLFHRKTVIFLCILVLLVPLLSTSVLHYEDQTSRTGWKHEYNDALESYNRQLARYPEFDAALWENELSWKADVARWQNQVQKYQFCLENEIASWDWRMEVVEKYFNNLLLLNCIRAGWNTADLELYLNYSANLNLSDIESENQNMMVYMLTNDSVTYNKEQLMKAEKNLVDLRSKSWVEDAARTIALAENEVAMWENYVSHKVAPFARDSWLSLCIMDIRDTAAKLINLENMTEEEKEVQYSSEEAYQAEIETLKDTIEKDQFALRWETPTVELQNMVYSVRATYLEFMELTIRLSYILVLLGIILSGIIIAGEYKMRTMKQLVIYPFKRSRILHAKFLMLEELMTLLTVVIAAVTCVIGWKVFHMEGNFPVFESVQNGTVFWVKYPVYLAIRYGFVLLLSWIAITFTFLIALISRSQLLSIAISLLALIGIPPLIRVLYEVIGSPVVLKYLFYGNLNWQGLLSNTAQAPYPLWWETLIAVFGWWFIIRRICYAFFQYQDIHEN